MIGKRVHIISGHDTGVSSVTFSGDGQRLASLTREGTVRVYDTTRLGETNAPQLLLTFTANQTPDRGTLVFSPDGRRLVVARDENTVNIWDVPLNGTRQTSAPRLTLRGHTAQVWGVTFSPNGRWVALGGEDNTVKLWDATTGGKPIRTLRGAQRCSQPGVI